MKIFFGVLGIMNVAISTYYAFVEDYSKATHYLVMGIWMFDSGSRL